MDISKLFHLVRNDSIKSFVPLTQVKTKSDREALEEMGNVISYTLEEFKNEFPAIDEEVISNIYYCNGSIKSYYFDRDNHLLFVILLSLKRVHSSKDEPFDAQLNRAINYFTDKINTHKYYGLIMSLGDRMRMEYINILIEDGLVEGLFDCFMDAYTLSDYGCEEISNDNMIKLLASRSAKDLIKASEIKDKALNEYPDTITVYRGEASLSTPCHLSWSWTLDINVANFFATRFGSDDSKIVKGTVKKEHVEVYINKEKECIISPGNVNIIEVLDLYGETWLESNMQNYFMNLYHIYRDKLIIEYAKAHPTESHSPVHSARVLCLALLLGILHELNHNEMENLATAIVYHDLGRTDDCIEDSHGKRGAELFLKREASSDIDKETVSFLIEYHCLDDEVGYEFIKANLGDNERIHLLYNIIKDADALDRVRFGMHGLDMNYLRLEESKKMTLIAMLCLRGIEIE